MRLDKLQRVLARLSVDAGLRSLAQENPKLAAETLGITTKELRQAASTVGLPAFARSLVRKRLSQVRTLLPRTAATLGQEFDRLFHVYAGSRSVGGVKKHQRDAIAFAAALGAVSTPDWLADLASYEAAWIESGMGRRMVLRRFRRRVYCDPPEAGQCWALWLRAPADKVRHFVFP